MINKDTKVKNEPNRFLFLRNADTAVTDIVAAIKPKQNCTDGSKSMSPLCVIKA